MPNIAFLTAIAVAAAVMPADPSTAPVERPRASTAPDRQVCKSQPRTGTRFQSKICKTRRQWEAEAEQARRDVADHVNAPRPNPAGRD